MFHGPEYANRAVKAMTAVGVPADVATSVVQDAGYQPTGGAAAGAPMPAAPMSAGNLPIPPGSKPVYGPNGELVGYRHD
jgi:hypothetical protein